MQSSLAPFVDFNHVHPEFVTVVVLSWSLTQKLEDALVWILGAGMLLDALTSVPFGAFSVSLLAMAVAANFWRDRLSDRAIILPVLLALPYSIFFNLCALIFLRMFGTPVAWGSALGNVIFPAALMNVGAMAIIFPLLSWINRMGRQQELTI